MVDTIITKTNGKDRVIDFRDQLQKSSVEGYAKMHNCGGRKTDGFPSTIKIVLCDFSKGKGEKSITVDANIEPTLPYEWHEVCKKSIGEVVIPLKNTEIGNIRKSVLEGGKIISCIPNILKGTMMFIADVLKGTKREDSLKTLGTSLKLVLKDWEYASSTNDSKMNVNKGINYIYQQDKVNVYKKGNDRYAPVSRIMVSRTHVRDDGALSTYPWTIKITNCEAIVEEKNTGATTFKMDTIRNKEEAYIMVSDRDMFRMTKRICAYIDCWEKAMCIPLILEGLKQKEAERNNYGGV